MKIRNNKDKEQPKEERLIYLFTSQMKELKQLSDSGNMTIPQCKKRADEIKMTALQVLQKIEEQKEDILKKMGRGVLLPAAKGIVDEMSKLTDELRYALEKNLKELELTSEVNWREQATLWAQLYAKWHDHQAIEEDIIQYIAHRISQMIAKDLQIIDDYQNRSLETIQTTGMEFDDLKKRLQSAINAPMQAMYRLKDPPTDISLEKIGEWVSTIQEQREELFDSVLQRIEKITAIARPLTALEIAADPISHAEMRHEVISLQKEFNDILIRLEHPENLDKAERCSLLSYLASLIEHAEELFSETSTSHEFKMILRDFIQKAYEKLDSFNLQ